MSTLEKLQKRLLDVNALHAAVAIMDWDQQVLMPKGGGEARAAQVGILSRMAHELFIDDHTANWLSGATQEVDPMSEEAVMLRVTKRDLDLRTKIPAELVERKSKLSCEAHDQWVLARQNNDFASFAPLLNEMFAIAREEAECLGYTDHIYDALLDQYEQGATAADCTKMFDTLKASSVGLLKEIVDRGRPVDDRPLYGTWDEAAQREFSLKITKAIGFDYSRGRLDTAPHPFCTGWSVNDVRLTTRYKDYLGSAIFGSLHEAGHGMYEQGSPKNWDRTPLAGGVSLGIHESQSRTWENIVGRSKAFWSWALPDLQKAFPAMAAYDLDSFYRMINKIEPSLIRVEADELTYNLHVMIRFEIECEVLTGQLAVLDMPEAWNSKYEKYLGIRPDSDSNGCLQDVHWSMGSIGYFPTYSMGNLLSYQFWAALRKSVPNTDELMAAGNFAPIHEWLRENIYSKGRSMPPKDLVRAVTGKEISADDYVAGLDKKYREIYGLS